MSHAAGLASAWGSCGTTSPLRPTSLVLPQPSGKHEKSWEYTLLPFLEGLACVSSSAGERLDNWGMSWVLWWWLRSRRSRCKTPVPAGVCPERGHEECVQRPGRGDRKALRILSRLWKSYPYPGHRVLSAHQRDVQARRCSFSGLIDGSRLQSPQEKER